MFDEYDEEDEEIRDKLKEIVSGILKLLSEKNYIELEKQSKGIRLSAADMEEAIKEYDCQLVMPPLDAYELMNVVKIMGGDSWYVVMPLWSQDEGESDLSIELTIVKESDNFIFEIENIHVL